MPPPIAAPADTPYVGNISLRVDVSDTAHRVIHVTETVPVSGDEVTLLYPQWLPGNHSPTGPISKLAGLVISADGQRIAWTRDPVNVFAFHVPVPPGTQDINVAFDYLAALRPREGRITFSSNILDLSWNTAVLYPAGYFSRDITFAPAIVLPAGWHYATALETTTQDGDTVHFAPTTLNTLVDSPLYAGVNYKRIDLSPSASNQVHLDVFADTAADLAITPEELAAHRALAVQAERLFDSHHYQHYDFLFSLTNALGGEGLEHHQSSEDSTRADYFTNWKSDAGHDLLAHEYTHSWNGKFRRPAGLWTPNFNVPMRDSLLWVYEGLTQYYGYVLATRAGLRTPEQTRELMSGIAANFAASRGRDWRPLLDTTNQPTVSQRSPVSWPSWQRGEDYYQEGLLIWLDADTRIRELSGGRKSLDDFAKAFYGINNGSYVTVTYTRNDLIAGLNAVQPYDWKEFFHQRVDEVQPNPPESGFTLGGYRLVYSDTKTAEWNPNSFSTSLGVQVAGDGELNNVWWGSPAFRAGLAPGMQIEAINDQAFSVEGLRQAILNAEKDAAPIRLLMKRGLQFSIVTVEYRGGLRYPHLERVAGTPARLDAILTPVP
ncbi:MAG: M61 family metallopeptidase [Terriglobales bacterium]